MLGMYLIVTKKFMKEFCITQKEVVEILYLLTELHICSYRFKFYKIGRLFSHCVYTTTQPPTLTPPPHKKKPNQPNKQKASSISQCDYTPRKIAGPKLSIKASVRDNFRQIWWMNSVQHSSFLSDLRQDLEV